MSRSLVLLGLAMIATALPAHSQTQDAPFINQWLVCGPFPQPVESAEASPRAGAAIGGKSWEYFDDRLWNRNYDNYQDLFGYYTIRKGVDTRNLYVYALSRVFSPVEQAAEFRFGASGTDRLFVNGAEVRKDSTPEEVQRDMRKQAVTLRKGWNQILLEIRHDFTADTNANGAEIAKDASVSYLGFYGRICDANGNELPGVVYSVAGDGPVLTIDTQPLAATDVIADPSAKGRGLPSNILPSGYVEWPYVWNKSLYGRASRCIWADAYRFQASGGQPGYQFRVIAGALPDGITLKPDGSLDGFCQKTGNFAFTLQVTDAKGQTARKDLAIEVKDRPTRWFEEGRVGALSHGIAVYPFWVDANFSADLWAERAKRQGHSLVSIEALQQNYYWPSRFEDPKHPRNQYQPRDKDGKVPDGLKPSADAVKRHGMKFGLYYATEGGGLGHHSTDVFVQNCSDLIRRYDPAYLYFDGPQAMPGANYDVMYSNVRNYGDDIIINSNVSHSWGGEFGDADLGTTEASHIYAGAEAARFTKRVIVEPWKSVHTKSNPTPYYAKRDDFRQVAKEMVMNVGRGYVDNNDQMPLMSRGPNWDSPADIAGRYPRAVQEFSDVREGVAAWFAPVGKPERHESTTGTVPYFLAGCGYEDDGKGNIESFAHGKGPQWGYATARDNAIYLHFIKGPDGKKGYTGEKTVTIGPVKDRVQQVVWLNESKPLSFKQEGQSLVITMEGIVADPVDTIVKIVTDNPARKYKLTNLTATGVAAPTPFLRDLRDGKKLTLVTMGTSLTGGTWKWPDVAIGEWLMKEFPGQITFFNEGVGASSTITGPGGNASLSGLNKVAAVIAHKPDVVFIEFGINDAYENGGYKQTPAESRKHLETIIDAILAANQRTQVVLQTMNPIWQPASQIPLERPHLDQYYQVYRDVANERGLLLIDNAAAWGALQAGNPEAFKALIPDGIHPQLPGIRRVLLPTFKAALEDVRGSLRVATEGWMTYPALKVPFAEGTLKFTSSNPAVAAVDAKGIVTAMAPGKAIITVEGGGEGATAKDALKVVVDSRKAIRVDDEMIGAVLKVNGKEAHTSCARSSSLPFTLEGRSLKGGPISLATAKVTFKSGVVDYAKGTPAQPVAIGGMPVFAVSKDLLKADPVEAATRAAVWAEVDLDGMKVTTNKVFVDIEARDPVEIGPVTASGHLGDFTPDKVNDGIAFDPGGFDRSKWSADGKTPSWIAFDFGAPQKVSQVEIRFNTLDQAYLNTPEVMEIQASADGRQWATLASVTPPAHGSGAYFGFTDSFRFKAAHSRYLRLAFPKGNPKGECVDLSDVRFFHDPVSNLALLAKITASSEFDGRYAPANVADGIIGEHGRGEWASKGEANPWIRLEWEGKTRVDRIVLCDRVHAEAYVKQGTLSFSDGSKIEVADLPNDGSAKTITFPAKSVQWIRFQASESQTPNNGLSEFSVFGPQ